MEKKITIREDYAQFVYDILEELREGDDNVFHLYPNIKKLQDRALPVVEDEPAQEAIFKQGIS